MTKQPTTKKRRDLDLGELTRAGVAGAEARRARTLDPILLERARGGVADPTNGRGTVTTGLIDAPDVSAY